VTDTQTSTPYTGATPARMSPYDEKLWSMLVHIGGIFFHVVAPLVGFLVLKDRGPFVRAHTATALNFQITLLIAHVVGVILSPIIIGVLVILAALVLNVVFSIIAALRANAGAPYAYPVAIPFVK